MLKLISLIGSVIDKAQKDHITAFSAQAAFFTVLSFFPFVIVVLSLMRFFPITPDDLIKLVTTYAPARYSPSIVAIINSLYGKVTKAYMTITIISLLWSASKGILSMMTGLNTIHEITEKRNYFVLRGISTIYIAVMAVGVLVALVAILFGNTLLNQLFAMYPILDSKRFVFTSIRFSLAFIILITMFIIMFCFLPSDKFRIRQILPGALFSTIGWIVLSSCISIYFDNFKFFNIMYGGLTSILLTLLWLYFCMMIFFIGAEINQFFMFAKAKKPLNHS